MNATPYLYPIILIALLLVTGAAEYLKIIPPGYFLPLLTLAIGLVAPSPVSFARPAASTQDTQLPHG